MRENHKIKLGLGSFWNCLLPMDLREASIGVGGGLQIRRERSIMLQYQQTLRRIDMGNDQNQNLSRRDFLKLTLTSLGATFLAACGRALGIPATPSAVALM